MQGCLRYRKRRRSWKAAAFATPSGTASAYQPSKIGHSFQALLLCPQQSLVQRHQAEVIRGGRVSKSITVDLVGVPAALSSRHGLSCRLTGWHSVCFLEQQPHVRVRSTVPSKQLLDKDSALQKWFVHQKD
jgi:hypothetical protein